MTNEKLRQQRRNHYLLNRERLIQKTVDWKKAHPNYAREYNLKTKSIRAVKRKKYYEDNPEKYKEMRFKSLMWRIGHPISYEEFNRLLIKQKGRCAICKNIDKKRRLSVDHCHKSGKVRGLLCQLCNTSLGGFKDNIDNLKSAIKYLKINHDSLSIK